MTINGRDNTPHAIIAKAPRGWWLQNLYTGALPMTSLNGYLPRELTIVGRYIEWSKSA